MNKNFSYNIKPDNSPEVFDKACREFEKAFPNAVKEKLIIDVDGSTIQRYYTDNGEMVIVDDYYIGAVYADSDFLISEITKSPDLLKMFIILN